MLVFKLWHSHLALTVDLCVAYYMLMLVSMTLTLMQGHRHNGRGRNSVEPLFKIFSCLAFFLNSFFFIS